MADEPVDWPNDRKSVTYQEVRNVLDAQRETLADIDDKAMRTNRVTVILLGAIVGFGQISGSIFDPFFARLGIGSLIFTIATAAYTYTESSFVTGPNRDYVEQLTANSFSGTTWDDDYLLTAAYWIEENNRVLEVNGYLLAISQLFLIVGVTCIAISLGM